MKKILRSVFVLVVALTLVTAATQSFFSDTETSENNRFVAGAIDLTIDSEAHYNGYICDDGTWSCEPWADYVVSFVQGTRNDGQPVLEERSDLSSALGPAEDNDTFNFVSLGLGIHGELVLGFQNRILNGDGNDLRVVETSFGSPSCGNYPEHARVYASQNGSVWTDLGNTCLDGEFDLGELEWAQFVKIVDTSDPASFNGSADGYDVDGVQAIHCGSTPENLAGESCNQSWTLSDLGPEHRFFDFADLKPGDKGENTISLHINNNEAYACMRTGRLQDNDLGLVEPELDAGDDTDGPGKGELSRYLEFFAWFDDGDNRWEPGEEPITQEPVLGSEFLNGSYPLAVPDDDPLPPGETSYIGIYWCMGDLGVDSETHALTCDGTVDANMAQTDETVATISFYVEQARHNDEFTCQ
ncbi:TasA family protein [Patescibacteria group bacterium]